MRYLGAVAVLVAVFAIAATKTITDFRVNHYCLEPQRKQHVSSANEETLLSTSSLRGQSSHTCSAYCVVGCALRSSVHRYAQTQQAMRMEERSTNTHTSTRIGRWCWTSDRVVEPIRSLAGVVCVRSCVKFKSGECGGSTPIWEFAFSSSSRPPGVL